MEQRPLRLGDILDDYCPRERRVTNHAVVAMIEETVKQTRCTTCDAEHPYKGGKAPRRKRADASSALYKEVLAGKGDAESPSVDAASGAQEHAPAPIAAPVEPRAIQERDEADEAPAAVPAPILSSKEVAPTPVMTDSTDSPEADAQGPDPEDGPVHRPLIRATLPRPEGQKDPRTPPDFTVRQAGGRGGNGNLPFRGGGSAPGSNRMRPRGGGGQGGNGHRPYGSGNPPGGSRFAGARQGQGPGRGQGGGFRNPQQPRQGGGGRKRSR
jgi:hypothetical protein